MSEIALSPESAAVIRATLPAVGGAIEEITTLFYSTLFAEHPELERDLFNRGNQAQGDQQRAVTPEVATAWEEVYWLMAHGLIAIERQLYNAAGVEPGQVWRTATVVRRTQESPDCIAITLRSEGGSSLPGFVPGQYTSVAVDLPDGARQIRQYSLTTPKSGGQWRITVKKDGQVSNHLHANLFEGDSLTVSLPFGNLTLHPEATDLSAIALPDGVKAYLCGPLPFMQNMRGQLLDAGVPAADIAYEVFGPDLWLQVA